MNTTTTAQNEYTDAGFANRRAYLDSLADDYGFHVSTVFAMASILGSSEDFDGLICALEDEADRLADIEALTVEDAA
jgi:hypothetical protein